MGTQRSLPCYPGMNGGGAEAYGLAGPAGGASSGDLGLGAAVPGYNLQIASGAPGEVTTVTAPISLLVMTLGGAVAGAMIGKGWLGALAGGVFGYMAGAGLRATTGLKA